jgi:hypothetical protein
MFQLKIGSGRVGRLTATAVVMIAAFTFAGSALAANLLVNGSFDTFVPNNATGGGWTTATMSSSPWGWNSVYGNPGPGFILNHTGLLNSDPRIYQTVAGLMPGAQYAITGEYALGTPTGTPNNSFEVRVDGTAVLSIGPHPDHTGFYTPFRGFATTFVATATSHVIMFAAECNGSDHHYAIDNLSMELVVVPVESSTWGKVKALYR